MTCNCKGKLPPTVALRVQCAQVAAMAMRVDPNVVVDAEGHTNRQIEAFGALCDRLYAFATKEVSGEDIYNFALDSTSTHAADLLLYRSKLLWQPLTALVGLREEHVHSLQAEYGDMPIGSLIQSQHVETTAALLETRKYLMDALYPYGLRLRMSTAEIRCWIEHGKQVDQATQG